MIGGLWRIYHLHVNAFGWSGKQCYLIHRGEGLPPVESCVGLGEPILFYLEVVWIFAGLTAFILYCYGSHLWFVSLKTTILFQLVNEYLCYFILKFVAVDLKLVDA